MNALTAAQVAASCGARIDRATTFEPFLNAAMAAYAVDTPMRQAAFLAQAGHESGGLKYVVELWGPTPAQSRYEGRKDLGNTQPGDGYKYRGRGLIQTTGRANYTTTGVALNLPLVQTPELLATPENAARSAAYFWHLKNLNALADEGKFETVTRRINGGLNGLDDRLIRYAGARKALGC